MPLGIMNIPGDLLIWDVHALISWQELHRWSDDVMLRTKVHVTLNAYHMD